VEDDIVIEEIEKRSESPKANNRLVEVARHNGIVHIIEAEDAFEEVRHDHGSEHRKQIPNDILSTGI